MRVLLPAISAGRSAGSSGFRTCAGAGAGAWIRQTRLSSVRNRTGERAARSARSRSNGRVSVGQSGWRPAEPSSSGSRPPSRSLESGRSRRAGSFSGFGAGGRSAGSLGLDRSRIDYLHCRQPLGSSAILPPQSGVAVCRITSCRLAATSEPRTSPTPASQISRSQSPLTRRYWISVPLIRRSRPQSAQRSRKIWCRNSTCSARLGTRQRCRRRIQQRVRLKKSTRDPGGGVSM
jgi:hypothetical protein